MDDNDAVEAEEAAAPPAEASGSFTNNNPTAGMLRAYKKYIDSTVEEQDGFERTHITAAAFIRSAE